jgi:hypothetical protein
MSGTLLMSVVATVGAGLVALGVVAWFRLNEYGQARRRSRPDEEWSMERYQPMARLLSGEDAESLRQSTGCPKVVDSWERSRRRIARLYLRELAVDFHRLHAKARALVAESPEQYSVLLPVLFNQQLAFRWALLMIEVRLAFGGLNVTSARVQRLIGAIEAMQREVSRVAAASAA